MVFTTTPTTTDDFLRNHYTGTLQGNMLDTSSTVTWTTSTTTAGGYRPLLKYSLCRFPSGNYRFILDSRDDEYGPVISSRNIMNEMPGASYDVGRLYPTLYTDELNVNTMNMAMRSNHNSIRALVLRIKSRLEVEDDINREYVPASLSGHPTEIMESYNKLMSKVQEKMNISFIHDMLFMDYNVVHESGELRHNPSRVYKLTNKISDRASLPIESLSIRRTDLPYIFDYSLSDLTMMSGNIAYENKIRQDISENYSFVNKMRKLMMSAYSGVIAVVEAEVPERYKVPNTIYYPPAWELDAGERRHLFAFFPSRKAVSQGWAAGIFSPAGNLIPLQHMRGRITICDYITDLIPGLMPLSHKVSFSKGVSLLEGKANKNQTVYPYGGPSVSIGGLPSRSAGQEQIDRFLAIGNVPSEPMTEEQGIYPRPYTHSHSNPFVRISSERIRQRMVEGFIRSHSIPGEPSGISNVELTIMDDPAGE